MSLQRNGKRRSERKGRRDQLCMSQRGRICRGRGRGLSLGERGRYELGGIGREKESLHFVDGEGLCCFERVGWSVVESTCAWSESASGAPIIIVVDKNQKVLFTAGGSSRDPPLGYK